MELHRNVSVAAALAQYVLGQPTKQVKAQLLTLSWFQYAIKTLYLINTWHLLNKYLQIIKSLTACLEIKFE